MVGKRDPISTAIGMHVRLKDIELNVGVIGSVFIVDNVPAYVLLYVTQKRAQCHQVYTKVLLTVHQLQLQLR